MPKKKKKQIRYKSKGYVGFLILVLVVFAVLLGGGLFKVNNPNDSGLGILLTPTIKPPNHTLQIQSLRLITATPSPTPESPNVPATSLNNNSTLASACLPPGKVPPPIGQRTQCSGTIVSFGIQKKLIPIAPWPLSGRPGYCVVPQYIVVHTTDSYDTTAEEVYRYFNSGAGGRGAATQYAIGKKGDAIQMTETLSKTVEVAYGVGNYGDTIGIELTQLGVYHSKSEAPPAQYIALLRLVKALMKQYNIPLGPYDYTWKSPDMFHHNYPRGVYGHYQLNPATRSDPGAGFLRDVRRDLAAMAC